MYVQKIYIAILFTSMLVVTFCRWEVEQQGVKRYKQEINNYEFSSRKQSERSKELSVLLSNALDDNYEILSENRGYSERVRELETRQLQLYNGYIDSLQQLQEIISRIDATRESNE